MSSWGAAASPANSASPATQRSFSIKHFSPSALAATGQLPTGVDLDGSGTAWQQNRCLLCLLYEEKLRVMQRHNEDLQRKLDWLVEDQKSGGANSKKQALMARIAGADDSDAKSKGRKYQLHVTHTAVLPTDAHKFIEIVAERDAVIAEREKDAEHLAVDRDNLRAALDDTQQQLELLKRRVRQLDKLNARRARIRRHKNLPIEEEGTDPEEEEEKRRLREQEVQPPNNNNNSNTARKRSKSGAAAAAAEDGGGASRAESPIDHSDDDYDYLGVGQSVASVAAARRARNEALVKLGPNERLRPIHTEGALGIISNNSTTSAARQGAEVSADSFAMMHAQQQQQQSLHHHSPAPTLAGVSPLPRSAHNHHSAASPAMTAAAAPAASVGYSGWSLREYEHLGPNSKHRQRGGGASTTAADGKLTRNIANDELGFGADDDHRLPPSPSALDRLRPLPAANSLKSMSLAEPSAQTWRVGGRAPRAPDFRAPGTTPPPDGDGRRQQGEDPALEFAQRSPHFTAFGPKK